MISEVKRRVKCYHCGEDCDGEDIHIEEKSFCCQGCKTVYQVINKVQMCDYYTMSTAPGINQKNAGRTQKFAMLDDDLVKSKLIHFKDNDQSHVTFYLPQMHCSSCIWLLENLHKINPDILQSRVDFLKKEVTIVFNHTKTSLRQMAELCNAVGYEPHISLNDLSEKKIKKYDKARIYKIGITGFCFGNIMMLSFPEYFSFGNIEEKGLKEMFSYLNLFLALPVFFYGASEFFISAWKGIKRKFLNIDAPIALAIVITFSRSVYEILSGNGAGYLDSMTGIVFFMLVGRFFQDKTYNTIAFNRDYTSYFPLGVTIIEEDKTEKQIPVSKLKAGQRIKVHSHEIIPADSILFFGKASIDYSFVTGESIPVEKGIGEIIYAGGKQTGGAIELEVVKEVSQSYLTQLWNNDTFKEDKKESEKSFIHLVSRYFTLGLFSIAFASSVYWYFNDPTKILNSVTAILIVACPCALLLSATFTNGNVIKVLQRFGFYVKNAEVIERIAKTDTVVFDKTGTITIQEESKVVYEGDTLSELQQQAVSLLSSQSSHPLSRAISDSITISSNLPVKEFHDIPGKGLSANIEGMECKLGSYEFVSGAPGFAEHTRVYLGFNDTVNGYYSIRSKYRGELASQIKKIKDRFGVSLLSGDNNSERTYLQNLFGNRSELLFEQKPQDKLNYVKRLQGKGKTVIMIGDGLNDAGALKQSNVGIAITDNINNFSPACDVVMDGKSFGLLDLLLEYCRKGKRIIYYSFAISLVYNMIGLYFAFFGMLQPVIAAILMPASSISIILFTTGMSSALSFKLIKRAKNKNRKTDKDHETY
ncbi:MAG: heavy metal translocating P-type ATPase [Bacteroidia bacterium]